MAVYTCKLGSADGKVFEKDFEATTPELLKQSLEEQGYYVFGIRRRRLDFLRDKGSAGRKIDSKELLSFNQEILVLLKAGLPIIQALDTILERLEKGKLSEILKEIREDVKGGLSLSDAFGKYPRAFPHLYIASIKAGEKTGDLPHTIRRYNDYLKRADALRKKFIGALVYPGILVTVATIAITVLLVYVVPTFTKVYADSGGELPLPTQMLIAFTTTLRKFFPLVVTGTIAGVFFLRKWAATDHGRFWLDTIKLRLPVFGIIFLRYSLSSFTRTLATVIGSGIPIVESLRMAVGTLNNRILERKMLEAIKKVEEGIRLSVALEAAKIMPPLALRMIGVGETTGSLEEMLADISEFFEEDIENRLGVLATAIEPAIMVVMGLVIGVIIITMYLPVFKLAGTVG